MRIHAGGDELFDKIGRFDFCLSKRNVSSTDRLFFSPCKTAPDVGVDEDIAHLYFDHLIAGMVCHPLHDPTYYNAHVIAHWNCISIAKASATVISNQKTSSLTPW